MQIRVNICSLFFPVCASSCEKLCSPHRNQYVSISNTLIVFNIEKSIEHSDSSLGIRFQSSCLHCLPKSQVHVVSNNLFGMVLITVSQMILANTTNPCSYLYRQKGKGKNRRTHAIETERCGTKERECEEKREIKRQTTRKLQKSFCFNSVFSSHKKLQ